MFKVRYLLCVVSVLLSPWLWAGEADVLKVKVTHLTGDQFRFMVTLKHADTGWKHYANAWEVVGPSGKVLGKRILHHPHVDEQPFTRSHKVTVPAGIKQVTVQAHDTVDGYGGKVVIVNLPPRN